MSSIDGIFLWFLGFIIKKISDSNTYIGKLTEHSAAASRRPGSPNKAGWISGCFALGRRNLNLTRQEGLGSAPRAADPQTKAAGADTDRAKVDGAHVPRLAEP